MRLLLISYLFPPAESPRAYRWGALADYFAGRGVEVDVVCAGGGVTAISTRKGLTIYTAPPGAIQLARERAIALASGRRPGTEGWLRKTARRLMGSMRWPDYSASWVSPAFAVSSSLARRHRYDGMISVSLPFAAHLVANQMRLARLLDCPWLVDVGDPFSLQGNSTQVYGQRFLRRSQRSEKLILDQCDNWFVTDPGAQDALVQALGVDGQKSRVALPLLSIPTDGATPSLGSFWTPDGRAPFRAAYAGIFYERVRPIERLGLLVNLLHEELGEGAFQIDLYGDNERWKTRLFSVSASAATHVRFCGPRDRSTLLAEITGYDALINFGNSTSFQVPSKVIEYAALAVPILNVKGKEDDTSEELLRGYPMTETVYIPDAPFPEAASHDVQRAALRTFLRRDFVAPDMASQRATWLDQFSPARVGEEYLSAIKVE